MKHMSLFFVSLLIFLEVFCGVFVLKASAVELQKDTFITGKQVYQPSLDAWKSAVLTNDISIGTKTWIGSLEGNGASDNKHKNKSRNTIIFAPNNVKFDDTLETILYFHGLTGFTKKEFENRTLPNLKTMINRGQNFILIFL